MSMDAASTLCERLLWRFLESSAPTTREDEYLTVKKLCVAYLPYAAGGKGSVGEQARVSLLCEALLRRCKSAGMLDNLSTPNTPNIEGVLSSETGSQPPPTNKRSTTR